MANSDTMPLPLIDETEFKSLKKEMNEYDTKRDTLIRRSRDVLQNSKHAIYSLHRDEFEKAATQIAEAKKVAVELLQLLETEPTLRAGSMTNSLEEYAEAVIFHEFLLNGRVARFSSPELEICDRNEYIGGVSDFTGELVRYAVRRATVRDVACVDRCTSVVGAVFEQLLQFDFRNSPLRKKFDGIKYNLQKLENIKYELSLTGLGVKRFAGIEGAAAGGGDGAADEQQQQPSQEGKSQAQKSSGGRSSKRARVGDEQ